MKIETAKIILAYTPHMLRQLSRSWFRRYWVLLIPFLLGIALRILYLLHTNHDERGHDVGGHIDYIKYIMEHWSIPPSQDGFEFYHPPLYYALSALMTKTETLLGISEQGQILSLQLVALALSVASLALAIGAGWMLLHRKHDRFALLLYGLLVATLPSLIFTASSINNDVLQQFLAFLALFLLVRWWQNRRTTDWILCTIVIALGMLTKSNMILFYPIALLCLLIAKNLSLRQRIHRVIELSLASALIAGWYVIPKYLAESSTQSAIVGNVDRMTGPIPNLARYFYTFNPWKILQYPFNDVHGFEARRSFLWEYYFRTIFFGEFDFGDAMRPLAVAILAIALVVLLIVIRHVWADVRRGNDSPSTPLWICLIIGILGMGVFRFMLPFSSSGNFRYTMLLVVPMAYYSVVGITKKSPLALLRIALLFAIILCWVAFLLWLAWVEL